MNISRRLSPIVSALAITIALVVTASAQKAGGFKEISNTDAAARAAAVFAVGAESEKDSVDLEFVTVHQAERQTVAGVRYRLCIEVAAPAEDEDEDDLITTVRAIVFRDLKGAYRLMSWEEEECGGDDDGD